MNFKEPVQKNKLLLYTKLNEGRKYMINLVSNGENDKILVSNPETFYRRKEIIFDQLKLFGYKQKQEIGIARLSRVGKRSGLYLFNLMH